LILFLKESSREKIRNEKILFLLQEERSEKKYPLPGLFKKRN